MITARFKCDVVTDYGSHRTIKLSPIYSNDPKSPNYSWSKATPSGAIDLTITNLEAKFIPGNSYFITFEDQGKYEHK